jgi:hypothetical protein
MRIACRESLDAHVAELQRRSQAATGEPSRICELLFRPECCDAGLTVQYSAGTGLLILACAECGVVLRRIAIADRRATQELARRLGLKPRVGPVTPDAAGPSV